MSEYLPRDVREQLAAARRQGLRRRATRSVHVGDEVFAIVEMRDDGFAVLAHDAPRLRGLVDIYDGARHLYRALIVAAAEEGDLMRYDFKRNTPAALTAPVDFERADSAIAGILTKA